MPRVPTYDTPQTELRALPGVRQSSVATPGFLAAGAEQGMRRAQGLLNAGTALSNAAVQMQERENADMLFRAETALKDDYLAYEASLRERKGQQAWGATRDTEQWFAEQEKKHGGELQNDVQRRFFAQSLTKMRQQAVGTVSAYEADQRRQSLAESANASIVGSINTAAANATQWYAKPDGATQPRTAEAAVTTTGPDGVPVSTAPQVEVTATRDPIAGVKSDILKRVQVLANLNGWSPEQKAAEEEKHLTNLHSQVIQNLAANNPSRAREYFAANKSEIAGSSYNTIESMLKEGSLRETAQMFADGVQQRKLSLEDAIAEARGKYSGDEEVATVAEVKTRFAEADAVMQRGQQQAANDAWKVVAGGGGRKQIPLPIWNGLTGQDQRSILDYLSAKANAGAGGIKTDIGTWMSVNDAIAAGTIKDSRDLMRYASRISTNDMQQFAEKLTRPDRIADAKVDTDDFNHIATLAGLTPFDAKDPEQKAALGNLRYQIEQQINAAQIAKKAPLTRDEKLTLMQREVDNKVMVDAWGRDPTRPAIMLSEDEQRRAYVNVAGQQVFLSAIPANERQKIIEARRRAGLPVTEQAIAEYWMRAGKPGSR